MNTKHFILVFVVLIVATSILIHLKKEDVDTNIEESTEEYTAADEILQAGSDAFAISYAHTVPGEYSEIFVTARSFPGDDIEVELTGPGDETRTKTLVADENGVAYFTFRIYQFGNYYARTTYNMRQTTHGQSITVE